MRRLKPVGHRFSYRVMSLLIDLDRLAAADRQSPLFGVNRAALYGFMNPTMATATDPRCAALRNVVRRTRYDLTGGRVLLLCYPRLLGYTFNPLSVYFCYRADDELALMIYEVRNTFGDIHAYLPSGAASEISAAGPAPEPGKAVLRFALHRDGDALPFSRFAAASHVKLRILETDRDGPLLAATFNGDRRPLNTVELLRSLFALPLVTLKITGAIHWEALRLCSRRAAGAAPGPRRAIPPWRTDRSNHYAPSALSARGKSEARSVIMPTRADRRSMDRPCPS